MIKPITTLGMLLCIALLNTSCESDAYFEVEDGHTKLFAFSEISPDDKIKVSVTTAVGINTTDEYMYPKQKDVKVTLYQDGIKLDNPGFRYIPNEKAFISQGGFRPKPGVTYGLQVEFKEGMAEVPQIYAETFIPEKDSISDATFTQGQGSYISGRLDLSKLKNKFYSLHFSENSSLVVSEVLGDSEGVHLIDEGRIILINGDLVNGDLVVDLLDVGIENPENITLELHSITSSAYNYYKAFSNQMAEHTHLLYEPVIDRSNFENGLGLFTGYNTARTTFQVH